MNNKEVNENLIKFWDEAQTLDEETRLDLKGQADLNYEDLAPSKKLLEAVKSLGNCSKVLDYGAGSGWASIIAHKAGAKLVKAVDLGDNIIDSIHFYMDFFDVKEGIEAIKIDTDWLKNEPSESYDAIVCSNVLDVVTSDVSISIIKEFKRILKKDGKIIIGLNFYMPIEAAKARGIDLVDNKYLFMDNVLRLMSLSDDEWKALFEPYFKDINLDYFSWPGEAKETRRLFILS